jgi:hypothetical protein
MRHITKFGLAAALALAATSPSFAATMQCGPFQTITPNPFPSSGPYTAAADGIVTGVAANDIIDLEQSGCVQVGIGGPTLIGRLIGANMNSTADQTVPMLIPTGAYYVPSSMVVKNCSTSLTTAKGQVYDAASKGGNVLFGSATTQVFTSCTGVGTAETLAATAATGGTAGAVVDSGSANPPILSLTTAQGAAATADVYVYGYVIGNK